MWSVTLISVQDMHLRMTPASSSLVQVYRTSPDRHLFMARPTGLSGNLSSRHFRKQGQGFVGTSSSKDRALFGYVMRVVGHA